MENQGVCRQITNATGTILLHVDEENFKVVNKLQKASCTKIRIGDYIVNDDQMKTTHIFSKDLIPKDFKPRHKSKYKLNKDKTKIETRFLSREKYNYLVIESQNEINLLNFLDKSLKLEIGFVAVFDRWIQIEIMEHSEFLKKYQILRSNKNNN